MAFLDKYIFQVTPAPTKENQSKIEWRGFLDDVTHEIVIWDDATNSELFRIGGGGAGVAWMLDGNTEGAEKTFGTNDAFDIPIVTNGVERMRIMASYNSIGIGTAAPDRSAIVEMASTSQGLLVPRMTTLQRNAIGAPATSLLIYNTGTSLFNYWDGAVWQEIDSNATSEWLLDGNTNGSEKYFGTNDNFDLPFYANGVERIRVLASNGYTGFNTPVPLASVHVTGIDATTLNFSLALEDNLANNLLRVRNDGLTFFGQRNCSISSSNILSAGEINIFGEQLIALDSTLGTVIIEANNKPLRFNTWHGGAANNIVEFAGRGMAGFESFIQTIDVDQPDPGFKSYIGATATGDDTTFRHCFVTGNVHIGYDELVSTNTTKLTIRSRNGLDDQYNLISEDDALNPLFRVRNDGVILMENLPIAAAGLPAGALWNNLGIINIV